MAELLRCKSCGYVAEAGKVGDVCPACGVPRKMMEPWKDPVSPPRRRVLDMHLHPIIDHFTVAFLAAGFVLALVALVLPALLPQLVADLMIGMLGVLPLAVVASFVSGLVDGSLRFRRTRAPALRAKKLLGAVLFLLSVAVAAIVLVAGPYEVWARYADVVLLAAGVACAGALGRDGARLLPAMFPG